MSMRSLLQKVALILFACLLSGLALGDAVPSAAAPSQSTKSAAELKAEVMGAIDGRQKMTQEIVDSLFSFSELGYQETWSSEYLVKILREAGFTVETGQAGMPTAFEARWGSGKPVIGLMTDIDSLPETSQKPGVPWHEPLIEGGPGHGEGHNTGMGLIVVAAMALKDVMEANDISGTISIVPGVAEELIGSRNFMVRAGMFEDLDAMIQVHISSAMSTSYGESGSGLVSTMYTFHGQSAHGAGAPWAGRSALDAVELMNVGWNFRREHLRLQQRSHYVIYNGGNQPNVVPSEATVWYYFREIDFPHIKRMHEIGTQIAEAAALMTDTEVTERMVGAAWQRHYNKTLAETVHANIEAVGMPDWSDDDQAFARAVQEMMGRETEGLRTEVSNPPSLPSGQNMGGGSDDIAEVSWNLPTIGLRYPGNIPGTIGHHWSAAIAEATPIAHKGCTTGAKVVATTVIDLLTDPSILEAAWDYFNEQTAEVKWESLVPDGVDPMVEIYQNKMDLYRPELEKLRYDPTRYPTYLEQLGVKYPTLKKPEGS
jgi:aminobenzoyl-glutamate utilization protein B